MHKYLVLMGFCLLGCVSSKSVDVWTDAALVSEQATVIENQQRLLDNMGDTIGTIRDDLASARADLNRAISQVDSLREQWQAIDQFVREIIKVEQRLEALQQPDRAENAGER
jgi:SMC interacting uncharacterized protein involved in chromosome segregation